MRSFSSMFVSVVLFTLVAFSSASAQKVDRIIFFGDSLSDAGNHFIFSGGASSRQPFSLEPPDASYDIGGHHFSNGNTWAEQLATALQSPNSGSPALRQPGVFTNYAVGRARARAGAPVFPDFDLSTQVNHFLSDFGGQVPPNSLIVMWIGGNDVNDAVSALSTDPTGQTSVGIIQSAATAVVNNVGLLYGAGGRMFLLANVPDLAQTPYVRFLGSNFNPVIPAIATLFTNHYDGALGQLVAGAPFLLPADPVHPLLFVRLLDVNALFAKILATPASFGITDTADRCTTPGVIGKAICTNPNQHLFWDGIHPTTSGHAAVAKAALQLLPAQ
jgi:phospholipase/lecithinase/hemolysin